MRKESEFFGMLSDVNERVVADSLHVINPEYNVNLGIKYLGQIDFGKGAIDASETSKSDFMNHLEYVAKDGLYYLPDLDQHYGGCMDGRSNVATLTDKPLRIPRPKVIGGPSLLIWNIAAVGNFSIIEGIDDPLEQFFVLNKALKDAGGKLGMHQVCGAARGVVPVLENYIEEFDSVSGLITAESTGILGPDGSPIRDELQKNAQKTHGIVSKVSNFTKENMLKVVQQIDGQDAVIKLDVDPTHPTQGHDEIGLLFAKVHNAVVYKDKINRETGKQMFYQNTVYAASLIQKIAQTKEEYNKGLIIADQMAVTGTATLGKNQHIGEIEGSLALEQ